MLSTQSHSCLEVIRRFAAIQEKHLADLENGVLRTAHLWSHERERMFERLQEGLAGIDFETMEQADRQILFTAIKDILTHEKELSCLVGMRKDELFAAISEIRKGRKSLQKYSATGCSGPEPRFLSSRM